VEVTWGPEFFEGVSIAGADVYASKKTAGSGGLAAEHQVQGPEASNSPLIEIPALGFRAGTP
jgi:hypothetical protein